MRKFLTFCFFLIIAFVSFSQKQYLAEYKAFGGIIAPHRLGMENLAQKNTYGFEVNFLIKSTNPTFFNKKYNYPIKGYGVSFNNLGNPDVLGNAWSIFTMMEFRLIHKNLFSFNTRVSPGLAYVTQRYDRYKNPENIALGTNVCFYFNLSFNFLYHLKNSGTDLRFSSGLQHFSNGAVRKPNLGLNQPFIAVSATTNIAIFEFSEDKEYSRENLSNHEIWAMGTLTTSDEYSIPPEGRGGGYPCSTLALGYNYQYSEIGKVGISADLFYDSNLHYYFDTNWNNLIVFHEDVKDILRSGISIGHQLIYNRLELVTFAGVYFYNKVRPGDNFYTRIGARYYLCDYVFINLTLKAFGFKAQYIEPGIGFCYRKKKY